MRTGHVAERVARAREPVWHAAALRAGAVAVVADGVAEVVGHRWAGAGVLGQGGEAGRREVARDRVTLGPPHSEPIHGTAARGDACAAVGRDHELLLQAG